MKDRAVAIIAIFCFLKFSALAQPVSSQQASPLFEGKDYKTALKSYEVLLKSDKENLEYNYKAGLCYLLGRIDYAKAIPYLEFVTRKKNVENEAWKYLGQAYQYSFHFDDAIWAYESYLRKADKKNSINVRRQIESCKNAKELCTTKVNVTFENLGKQINTESDEYNPVFPSNKAFLSFSSNRGNRGSYDADIYISDLKQESWAKAKNLGNSINTTSFSENECGLSNDGKLMFISVKDNIEKGTSDIATTSISGKTFEAPVMLEDKINTIYNESSASISGDKNTLYFVSDRKGGIGKKDIYCSGRLPNGKWGVATLLSSNINTIYNEDFPFLMPDGKTLYFSSEGHINMGGYDIFKSIWNEDGKDWSEAINLGCPINSPDDNFNFVISASGKEAYVSAIRPEGYGNYDIYKVIFNAIEPKYTVFSGNLQSGEQNINSSATITLIDTKTKGVVGSFRVTESKQGRYLICAAPGDYAAIIEVEGLPTITEQITVIDKSSETNELIEFNKDFKVVK